MPFAVFRRHQRKLLAIFAILAMFGFVVADSLPRLLNGGGGSGGNPTVVTLYGRDVRRSDVNEMAIARRNANQFMAELTGLATRRPVMQYFGDVSTRSIVDALVLKHEADKLGMPDGPEVAREWLKQRFGTGMTKELFELILYRFNNQVSGEQLLSQIAEQIRLTNVRFLLGSPVVTPLDVYQSYRDQTERVSVKAVGFRVEDYLSEVKDPAPSQAQAFYEKYKDARPDPTRPTPGFKVPRQIQVEVLTLDGDALTRATKDKLTEAELLSYYENHKAEFKKPSAFPEEIFVNKPGEPNLTPPIVSTFAEVRVYIANSLADEKAQAQINDVLGKIKDEVMIPFADKYLEAAEEIAEARKQGSTSAATLPEPGSLTEIARKEGLRFEKTPLLTRDKADRYGLISGAQVGLTRLSEGHKFAEELFDTKSSLFEPIEFTDVTGHRFLVRKLQDLSPRVPTLDEIRPEVTRAWKLEQARVPAEKAAKAYAETVKKDGGAIKGEIVAGHPVITTDAVSKLQPGLPLPGNFFMTGPPSPTEIAQIPNAGTTLRDAYFGLTEGAVAVAPDQPEAVYYVLALNRRNPASFAVLYAPNGDVARYQREAVDEAYKKRDETWLSELRAQAGLKPDWAPADEPKKDTDLASND